MRYLGGKSRIAKQLAEVIDHYRQPDQLVWDAFCGGLSMSVALSKNGPVWSTDANAALISLYKAVQQGWEPPTDVSKETWQAAKSLPDSDPMKAFCGIGCSYVGIWFRGYEPPMRTHVVKSGPSCGRVNREFRQRQAAKAMKMNVRGLRLEALDFLAVEPQPTAALLYLDPPYAGTTGYDGAPPFDHSKFVERVRGWARFTHVFVSEYSFPIGSVALSIEPANRGRRPNLNAGKKGALVVERLYHLHPGTK